MLQIKLGVELATLKLPFKQALLTARELGMSGVEIDVRHELRAGELTHTGVRQLRKMLDDLNLRVAAVAYRTRRGYAVLDDLERRLDATKEAMRLAYDLGAGVVLNHLGRIPPESDAAGLGTLVQALTDLGRYGQRVGAVLAAETGTESGADLAALLARLPPHSIAVSFDPASLILHGHAPREAIVPLAPHVAHMRATDATRDLALGRGFEVPLGQGSADFPELLSVLEEQQYRGYLTIARRHSAQPLADVRQAAEFLRNL